MDGKKDEPKLESEGAVIPEQSPFSDGPELIYPWTDADRHLQELGE